MGEIILFNIAIDGPSASGKSTIAKAIAKQLGMVHIDTGSMYRSIAYMCIENHIDLEDEAAVVGMCAKTELSLHKDGSIYANGNDVSNLIRNDKVSKGASIVSKYKEVRDMMVDKQRQIASQKGFVLDGRDITSVVLPDAEVKIFQSADVAVRAKRRFDEMMKMGQDVNYDDVYNDLVERDHRDTTRSESPLIKVPDALEINTSYLSIDEVVELVMNHIESRGLND